MSPTNSRAQEREFDNAVAQIRSFAFRRELAVREIASPEQIAPRSFALAANVLSDSDSGDSPYGAGRFILLHDPAAAEQWGGDFRVVSFAQAPLETEIGEDALLADVAWSWLMDALEHRGAAFTAPAGTATKILSTGFGSLKSQGSGAQLELRASWTPLGADFGAHAAAWSELLCLLAGLPQEADGLASIREQRLQRDERT